MRSRLPTSLRQALVSTCIAGVCIAALGAQTLPILDDFAGNTLNPRLWYPYEQPAFIQVQNSQLQFAIPAGKSAGDLTAVGGFQGDFDFILSVSGVVTKHSSGRAGVWLYLYDTKTNDDDFYIGFSLGSNPGNYFGVGGSGIPSQQNTVGTFSSAQLRLQRSTSNGSTTVRAAYRIGNGNWISLPASPQPNVMAHDVNLAIEIGAGRDAPFSIYFESVQHGGKRIDGERLYGSTCAKMLARTYNYPFPGAPNFGCVAQRVQAGTPLVFLIGSAPLSPGVPIPPLTSCLLHTWPDVLAIGIPPANASGEGAVALPVPNIRAKFYAQFAAVSFVPLSVQLTNGLECQVPPTVR